MFGVGWTEIVVVFILALLIFGPRRLPEIGRSLGKAMGMFKEASREVRRSMAEMQSEFDAEIREARRAGDDLKRDLLEDHTGQDSIDREHGRPFPYEAEEESEPPPPPSGPSPAG